MEKEIESRKKLPFTDVENLAKTIKDTHFSEVLRGEIFLARYGMNSVLKKYAGFPMDYKIHVLFEHGVIYTDYVSGGFRIHEYLPSMVASQYRINILKQQKGYKGAYAIGPYIHYANPLLTKEEIKAEKERLGRTLLVFPSHSINTTTSKFNIEEFINKIKETSKDFDSVRICMYYQDVLLKRHVSYQKKGFEVVTAGNYNDYYFMHRLKSIIKTSDITMANDIGTHLGYCIYLNKPHYLFKQSITHEHANKFDGNLVDEAVTKQKFSNNVTNITKLFSEYHETITKEQYELISYLWGFNEVKTHSELKELIIRINKNYSNIQYYLSCIKRAKDILIEKGSLK
ncbi:hypothetical protein [uncultured Methanobrevibacter sp.]|uniref:hypothetical protein n=1 Tax=uncultured Methanobrevibacter sp. TaxID=253161 RepID=UPI0025EAE393|nr:hypothetical protein [uncultured Methanobrevibacter sp.]